MRNQLGVERTMIAMRRVFRFCWYLRFESVVTSTSKPLFQQCQVTRHSSALTTPARMQSPLNGAKATVAMEQGCLGRKVQALRRGLMRSVQHAPKPFEPALASRQGTTPRTVIPMHRLQDSQTKSIQVRGYRGTTRRHLRILDCVQPPHTTTNRS